MSNTDNEHFFKFTDQLEAHLLIHAKFVFNQVYSSEKYLFTYNWEKIILLIY